MDSRFLIICTLLAVLHGVKSDVEYDRQLSITLNHALDSSNPDVFTHRGLLQVRSTASGLNTLSQKALAEDERKLIKRLLREDSIYRVEAICRSSSGSETTFHTFLKGESMLQSGLSDIVTINLDHVGNVISVSLSPAFANAVDENTVPSTFNSTVVVRHMEPGPIPDTITYMQKLEQERLAKERGETKDNRSFFAKYWMYIVPVLIVLFISNSPGAQEGGGGGGR